jgi:hypothetical protein
VLKVPGASRRIPVISDSQSQKLSKLENTSISDLTADSEETISRMEVPYSYEERVMITEMLFYSFEKGQKALLMVLNSGEFLLYQ